MDILISSNLERLIFEISGRNTDSTAEKMAELKAKGKYSVNGDEFKLLEKEFFAGYTDEDECRAEIEYIFDEYGYVADPHTSVAISVADNYNSTVTSTRPIVILSTASPYKFACDVYGAISGKKIKDAFKASQMLSEESAMPVPEQITELQNKEKRFTKVIDRTETVESVFEFVKNFKEN
jgi:threonine synthase